jgi:hypothetical protein
VNIALWVLQSLLALWTIMGGSYMLNNPVALSAGAAKPWPAGLLLGHGALQIVMALGLFWPKTAAYAAVGLAGLFLIDAVMPMSKAYEGFPGLLWPLIPALLAAFLAYGRLVLSPFKSL